MGKLLKTKYSDVENRVLKKSSRRDKSVKTVSVKPHDPDRNQEKPKTKRKIVSAENTDEPKNKICRTETQESTLIDIVLQQHINEIDKQNQFICSKFSVVKGNNPEDYRLTLKDDDNSDLFFHDELRSTYENYTNKDIGFQIIDEISLEGLDGITIEALWKRLLVGLECPFIVNDNIKEVIWRLLCRNTKIQFFELPQPRGVLDIYDRFKYLDNELGVVMEMAYELPNIYEHKLVNHPTIQGSSATFDTRNDITSTVNKLSLKTTEKTYGRALVMVATQELRRNALFNESADPTIELQNLEYCILEIIGRSRKHGELTQGNMSISSHFNMDPKSVFHYKKQLYQNNLLAKQFFYIKSAVTDQNKTGRLLHLKRFYHAMKPKQLLIAERIINILKTKPGYRLEYGELRKIFADNHQSVVKVVKSPEFHKYVKTDCLYPYRALYPNAKKSEYMRKARPTEKCIRCMELIDPYINIVANWSNDQADSDEEDDDAEEGQTGSKIYNMECFKEVYLHILSKGERGCTLHDVEKLIGIDNVTVRMVLKKLIAKKSVDVRKFDKGKQRHLVYYANSLYDKELQEDLRFDVPKSSRNVLARIKEKQKAARKKLESAQGIKETFNFTETSFKFPHVMEIERPHLACPFFIRIWKMPSYHKIDEKACSFISISRNYVIKLNARTFGPGQFYGINEVLNDITSKLSLPLLENNCGDFYIAKTDVNYITKLILLKGALGEITINGETLSRKRKRHAGPPLPLLLENSGKGKESDKKLLYMGNNPVTILSEKNDEIFVDIIVSTPPAAFQDDFEYPKSRELSERVMSRIRTILNIVQERKIFEDIHKLLKIIEEIEIAEGYKKKIDRKSLARILSKLVTEGYVKIYKLIICNGKITKTQTFLCHPSVTHTNSIIQSAYQQLKWKYFLGTQKKTAKPYVPSIQKEIEEKLQHGTSPFRESDVMNSIAEMREMNKLKYSEIKSRYNQQVGKSYGFKPKFIRMRVIHEVLFYLIYSYDKQSVPLTNDEVADLFRSYRIDLTDEDLEKMPKIYCKEMSWKMFIPPLPYHKGWIEGWALVCDVILRLPISVLCKVHNLSYEMNEIRDILNHPIKRFYLVKDLPVNIRNAALFKRKYLFDIHETLCRLAYCGLLQFGPQKYKEKDQVFIYLNRQGALLDTTTTEPSYHKITLKEYKQLAFYFNTQADVDSYWYNVYGISLSTKLNAKQPGQLVTLVDVSAKPELLCAIKSKTPEEALQDDNGEIPGDRRGAAGLDSSLWAHIMRNWFWANKKVRPGNEPTAVMGLRKEKLEKILPQNLPFNELHISQSNINKFYLHIAAKGGRDTQLKSYKKTVPVPLKPSKTIQKITRKIPSRYKKTLRTYFDHVDKVILKRIGRMMKVRWNKKEDAILVMCKAASILLNPKNTKKQLVPYTTVRDVLHRTCPESRNKTSRACQRRLKTHISENYPHLEDNASALFRLKPISKYYSVLVNNILREEVEDGQPFRLKESELSVAFVILMAYMVQHKEEVENLLQGNTTNINHLADNNLEYVERNLVEVEQNSLKYQEAKEEDDIKKDVLKTVVHSSLESKNHPGWAFQLFKIYQKYPDNLIRDAVGELKHSQTISFKKMMSKKDKARCHLPFQLSNIYVFSQSTTFNLTTAVEAYKTFLNIKENNKFLDFSQDIVDSKKYGQLLGLNEFCSYWEKFRMKFFLPHNTVILNPHIKDHGELVNELAVRWQLKLKNMQQENADADLEPEMEAECDRSDTNKPDVRSSQKEGGKSTSSHNKPKGEDYGVDDSGPLDLTVDTGNLETIDRLKTWVTDCMETAKERRSPSPDFITAEDYNYTLADGQSDTDAEDEDEHNETEGFKLTCDAEIEKMNLKVAKKMHDKDKIPSLEEIREGMLQSTSPQEKRKIPYITDLSFLLNESFPDLNKDEKTLERLKNHFITQYALLEDIIVEGREEMQDSCMMKYLQQGMRNKDLWNRLHSEMVIDQPSEMSAVYEVLASKGGTQSEFALADEVLAFVYEKKELGATGPQIKEYFHVDTNSLEMVVKVLVDNRIFLKAGICSITFVHYLYQSIWIIETFVLTNDEQRALEETTTKVKKEVRENIDKQLSNKKRIRVKVVPWTKVDGSLNEESLKNWLCNILSHCLDYPNISLKRLCEKFCYVKPVDIHRLLEILQELGCVEIMVYEETNPDLFTTWGSSKERRATILDSLDDMYIAPNNASMTYMGLFFCDLEE